MKSIKMGVARERVGVAQIFFDVLISFEEYFPFDLLADFYGVSMISHL